MVSYDLNSYDQRDCGECNRVVELPLSLALEYDQAGERPLCSRCGGEDAFTVTDERI